MAQRPGEFCPADEQSREGRRPSEPEGSRCLPPLLLLGTLRPEAGRPVGGDGKRLLLLFGRSAFLLHKREKIMTSSFLSLQAAAAAPLQISAPDNARIHFCVHFMTLWKSRTRSPLT